MIQGKEWIKETNALIEDLEAEQQTLQDKYDKLAEELMDLRHHIEVAHKLVGAYMRKHGMESTTPDNIQMGSLANKSYPQMLAEIAKQSNGVLNIADATRILLEAHVGRDRQQVLRNINNVLSRYRDHFSKIGKGQYRFSNHIQHTTAEHTNRKRRESIGLRPRSRAKSGIEQAVRELKKRNPQWTKKEVLTHLTQKGFNFAGKQPDKALNMVWGKLGYSKENKQQPLPIAASMTLPIEHLAAVPLT